MNASILLRAAAAAVIAVTALAAAACTATRPGAAGPHAARHDQPAAAPLAPCAAAPLPLPVSSPSLRVAGALAARFATEYETRLPGQTPGQWLARLRPMATAPLAAALARVAATSALWLPGQAVTARTVAEAIRLLAPGSVILTVTVRRAALASSGSATTTVHVAVTVVRAGGGWAAYDIEPASAGNSG